MTSFEGVNFRKKMAFIALLLVFACQNPISNEIPTLFYRSSLECHIDNIWVPCKESDFCQSLNSIKHRWTEDPMKSMTMQFDLVCDKRFIEAILIFLGPVAQMMAYFTSVFYQVPRKSKFPVIMKILLVQGLTLLSTQLFNSSLFIVSLIRVVWNFVWAYFFSLILQYVEENYPKRVYLETPVYMNIIWPVGGIIFIFATFYNGYWVSHFTYLMAIPMLITAGVFYALTPKEIEKRDSLLISEISPNEEVLKRRNFINEMKQTITELKQETASMKNMFIFLTLWVVSTFGYNGTFIAFNKLKGPLQTNVIISIVAELSGSLSIMYFLKKYDCVKILYYNFLVIGIIQGSTLFFNESFPIGLSVVINASKASNKIMFAANLLALQYWVKPKFIPFAFSMANIISIVFNSILPFYKYYMDFLQVNFFTGIGILSIVCAVMVKASVKIRDPIYEKINESNDIEMRKFSEMCETPQASTLTEII